MLQKTILASLADPWMEPDCTQCSGKHASALGTAHLHFFSACMQHPCFWFCMLELGCRAEGRLPFPLFCVGLLVFSMRLCMFVFSRVCLQSAQTGYLQGARLSEACLKLGLHQLGNILVLGHDDLKLHSPPRRQHVHVRCINCRLSALVCGASQRFHNSLTL